MPSPVPHQPHPDVAIAKNVLKEIKPGEILPYATAAKALSVSVNDPVFARRFSAARKALLRPEEGGLSIVCVPGEGFLREDSEQITARVGGRETKSIRKKASKAIRTLNTIDVAAVDPQKKAEIYGHVGCLGAILIAASKPAREKMIAAAKVAQAEIATQKALEILQGRNGDTT